MTLNRPQPLKACLRKPARRPTRQSVANSRGMSLVELMVGITIGLFIVAAAVTLVANQLADNRKLTVELQVQQDLRATADIITRQLRRAGIQYVTVAQLNVQSEGTTPPIPNTLAEVSTSATQDRVNYWYYYNAGDLGPYGYRLNNGVIEARMATAWQQLTDPLVMRVTDFTVALINATDTPLPCPNACADGTSGCWPTLRVRELDVVIRAQALNDPLIQREVRTRVRLRNDQIAFNDPLNPAQFCPAG